MSPRLSCLAVGLSVVCLGCTSTLSGGAGADPALGPDGGQAPTPGPGPGQNPGTQACTTSVTAAEGVSLPVDIIWAIDNSGSMTEEIQIVEQKLNEFVGRISGWGIDYRIIMISERGRNGNAVCTPAPLSDGDCGDAERYLTVDTTVGSDEALPKMANRYDDYRGFLRADSVKSFVAVTDDESDESAQWFLDKLEPRPEFAASDAAPFGFIFHSIVSWGADADRGCPSGADYGHRYLELTELTGGVKAKVCDADWEPIFSALEAAVVGGSRLPCAFDVPAGGNPDEVNVVFTPAGGASTTIGQVANEASCSGSGWYYDDPLSPSQILACPATCEDLNTEGDVEIQLGCATESVD